MTKKSKNKKKQSFRKKSRLLILLFAMSALFFCSTAFCEDATPPATTPTPAFNVNIVEGQANITRTGLQTEITQTVAGNLIADGNLSTISNEIVRIILMSSNNNALLRDITGAATIANGSYYCNGGLFMVNPQGFIFGSSAQIQAANIVVSTLNISNADFLTGCSTGQYKFYGQGAYIINQGRLIPQPGGYVCLFSQAIRNEGTIQAQLGTIAIAAGEAITMTTVDLDDRGTIFVGIDKAVESEILGPDGKKLNNAIENTSTGTISANGGTVLLTAKILNKIFDHAINNAGVIEARTLTTGENGEIKLIVEGAPVINTGTIEARDIKIEVKGADFINTIIGKVIGDGTQGKVNGGNIYIEALNVMQKGVISTNAYEGGTGGNIDIIADYSVVLDENSTTSAACPTLYIGNGGRILINSRKGSVSILDKALIDISAGSISGDGGFVKVGALDQLGFSVGCSSLKLIIASGTPEQSPPSEWTVAYINSISFLDTGLFN